MSDSEVPKVDSEKSKEQQIAKALVDTTKKRKAEDEIEIDLSSSIPLSKKQKRLLRRGKITLEELNAKFNIDPESIKEFENEKAEKGKSEGSGDNDSEKSDDKKKADKKFGVWIGNLSFDTSKDDIIKLILLKSKDQEELAEMTEKDVVRINMPLAQNDGKKIKNKGFCYMNFKTQEQMDFVISLSESQLNGRNLLVKSSDSYEGRPNKNDLVSLSKNPPSRILFVGNLSFDTTDDLLRKHYQHCGEIIKIRMATFQDSGKCKGFAFVDFKTEEGATKALTDKSCRKIAGRPLRMEYGEDRSKRQVRKKPSTSFEKNFDASTAPAPTADNYSSAKTERKPAKKFNQRQNHDSNSRVKSSVALAKAQRASVAIVKSTGKKVTFD